MANQYEKTPDEKYSFDELCRIIARLRAPGGCPWDRDQTHESLKVCLTDECNEVLEAIDAGDHENLCEELGDVLLQVIFHRDLAEEEGWFSLEDVVDGVARKMIRRHPHVFGDAKAATPEEALSLWKAMKKKEREGGL